MWGYRITRALAYLVFLLTVVPTFLFGALWAGCRPGVVGVSLPHPREGGGGAFKGVTHDLEQYEHPEDQTYLTFPEWYIVYSAVEYGDFIEKSPSSGFPYFGSVGQYWSSYCKVYALTRSDYPFNVGYHTTLFVIGASFSVEQTAKALYENIFGRMTEWMSKGGDTEEDRYGRAVAKEYGVFIHTIPWYKFPFLEKLKGLWRDTDVWGPYVIRKWERKVSLSIEYGIKSLYAWVIEQGTQTTYAPETLEMYVLVEGEPASGVEGVRIVKGDSEPMVIVVPRYEAFTRAISTLAKRGVRFLEIAGNDEILMSVIAPREWTYEANEARTLFTMNILIESNLQRVNMYVPVENLHTILNDVEKEGVRLEHIYDY